MPSEESSGTPSDEAQRAITDGGVQTPFPVEGTITLMEKGSMTSLPCMDEWLTETSSGNFLEKATERVKQEYETGDEVRVLFTADRSGEECGDFRILGAADEVEA